MVEQDRPEAERPTADQRKYLRVPLIVRNVQVDDGKKTFFGYASNISRGGLFIGTVNPREPQETCRVELTLPPPVDRTIQCRCEVVWKRTYTRKGQHEPGMGLKFLDLPEEIAETIDAWAQEAGE